MLINDYLAIEKEHQGILKHSAYNWANGWDYVAEGEKAPPNESSMWGDYHMVELCFFANKILKEEYYTFFDFIH